MHRQFADTRFMVKGVRRMRKRLRWAIIGTSAIAGAVLGVATMPKHAQGGAHLASGGTLPAWPWAPHGITWSPPGFTSLPYAVKVTHDSSLPQGQRVLIRPGEPGTVYGVGSVKTVVSPPVNAHVLVGTATVHTLSIAGHTYRYDKVLSVLTTAYNGSIGMNGRWGAVAAWDGKPLHPGNVAVDPSVIPFGTYLYIDGYGPARAVDSGSAIIGDHIDLFFNESAAKVGAWGLQWHKVYILVSKPANYPG